MEHLRLGQLREGNRNYGGVGVPVELVGDLLCATADGIDDICDLMEEMNTKLDRMISVVAEGTEKAGESLAEAERSREVIVRAAEAVERLSSVLEATNPRSSNQRT